MPSATRIVRIVIADDHELFRDGLRGLLETEPDFEIVGEASDGKEAVRLAKELQPDLLLLDVAMPRMGGVEALATLQGETTKTILLTAGIAPNDLLRAVQLGARGVVLKDSATRVLIDGIVRVMEGKYLIGAGVSDDLAHALHHLQSPITPRYGLTAREREILSLVVAGASNKDIADRLDIRLQTVKHHVSNIFDKTGVSSRLELALLALRQGLVEPD